MKADMANSKYITKQDSYHKKAKCSDNLEIRLRSICRIRDDFMVYEVDL